MSSGNKHQYLPTSDLIAAGLGKIKIKNKVNIV